MRHYIPYGMPHMHLYASRNFRRNAERNADPNFPDYCEGPRRARREFFIPT
jgi:hypothetical protein